MAFSFLEAKCGSDSFHCCECSALTVLFCSKLAEASKELCISVQDWMGLGSGPSWWMRAGNVLKDKLATAVVALLSPSNNPSSSNLSQTKIQNEDPIFAEYLLNTEVAQGRNYTDGMAIGGPAKMHDAHVVRTNGDKKSLIYVSERHFPRLFSNSSNSLTKIVFKVPSGRLI
jgi:hypothetical protein